MFCDTFLTLYMFTLSVNFIIGLVLDILASWGRLLLALFISIVLSIFLGIAAATNKKAEGAIVQFLDLFQTLPILAFFPVVITFVVLFLPNYIGVNIAVVFLIITSMVWNIAFGVYESVKNIPESIKEVAAISHLTSWQRIKSVYLPASIPRIAYQSMTSWSVGLFYLVTSEIFSTGSAHFAVRYGIGVEIAKLVLSNTPVQYVTALAFLIAAILLTRYVFLSPFSAYSEKFAFNEEQKQTKSRMLSFYSRIGKFLARLLPRKNNDVVPKKKIGKYAAIEKKETLSEPAHPLLSSAVLPITLFIIFALLVIATGAYSSLREIGTALLFSFLRVWGMYLLCAALVVPIGIKIAKSTRAFEPLLAVLQTFAAIPATVLLPLLIAFLFLLPYGNELVAMSVIFFAMVWYLLFSVISGMRAVSDDFRNIVGIFRMKWTRAWRDVYIPAILPSFVTGSITAIGGAWNALIVAEYFSVQVPLNQTVPGSCGAAACNQTVVLSQVGSGIGKLLDIATFKGDIKLVLVTLAAMVVMIVLINKFVWQRLYKTVTAKYRIE